MGRAAVRYQPRAKRRLQARADAILAGFGQTGKAERHAKSKPQAPGITRERADATGLDYRVELSNDGAGRTSTVRRVLAVR
jgi:hypothetical protein